MHCWSLAAGVVTAGLVATADQVSKALISNSMYLHESIRIAGDFIRLTYARNSGIAFGLSPGFLKGPLLLVITIAGSILILVFLLTQRQLGMAKSMIVGLILGGAVGNLIDRVITGEVVDFLDVGVGSTRWPVFNVADSAVVVGVVLYVLSDKKHHSVAPARTSEGIDQNVA
jgi:signal peptidase II